MATEAPPKASVEDVDFIPPKPKPEDLIAEDAMLREALMRGDLATFELWKQRQERALGEKPDPVEHALLLIRAARIYQSANENENAATLLRRAVRMLHGKDESAEQMALTFLREVGGEKAVVELRSEERRALRKRNAAIQKELIAIRNAKTPEQLTPDEQAHIVKLKEELQELINKELLLAK